MNKLTCVEPGCNNKRQKLRGRCRTHFEKLKVDGVLPPIPGPTLPEVFNRNVSRTESCWIWKGPLGGDNYGVQVHAGKRYRAHRLSWELHKSDPLPPIIDHMCREPRCVNPDHLQSATHKTNGENLPRENATNKTTGIRGVHYNARSGRYHAYASSNGKRVHAGTFATLTEAEAAAIAVRLRIQTNNLADRVGLIEGNHALQVRPGGRPVQ